MEINIIFLNVVENLSNNAHEHEKKSTLNQMPSDVVFK